MSDFVTQFRSARRCGAPIVKIDTPDPAQTIERLSNGTVMSESTPVVQWDRCQGWKARNKAGVEALRQVVSDLGGDVDLPALTADPIECMLLALKLPKRTVLFAINAHRYLGDSTPGGAAFVQAVWNLRDEFKQDNRTLVLLGPSVVLPPELTGDVVPLDEPLPGEGELGEIIESVFEALEAKCPAADKERAVDALRGLPAFSAEQAVAMAIDPKEKKVDHDALWERKRAMIAATPGLSVWGGSETFADVGGNEQVKSYFTKLFNGLEAPRVVVFIDEMEKAFAGAGGNGGPGDSSGVSQGFHGQFLTYMQDYKVEGVLELGPPGAAKSAVAKALAGEFDRPMIVLDLGGMKASLVGESEQRLRTALKVITAVGGGRALFVATCNRISTLSPELRRRFQRVFFFDLPTAEEREMIWKLYEKKYDLSGQRPDDAGWTGAEIEQAARLAYRLKIPLLETAQYIVPVSKSAKAEIDELRKSADQRFLSAARPGHYSFEQSNPYEVKIAAKTRRTLGRDN